MSLKIIGTGMSRTGTLCTKTALQTLGFGHCKLIKRPHLPAVQSFAPDMIEQSQRTAAIRAANAAFDFHAQGPVWAVREDGPFS